MYITKNTKALLAITIIGAATIGGLCTAIVSAAIPSSVDGKIYACYRNAASLTDAKGALRVIDNQTTQTCTAQETALAWTQSPTAPQEDAYARIYGTYNPVTNITEGTLDSALSKHITNVEFIESDGQTSACITVAYEPRNIAVTGGASFAPNVAIKVAGTNPANGGWTTAEAAERCQGTSANAYLASIGDEAWFIFKR